MIYRGFHLQFIVAMQEFDDAETAINFSAEIITSIFFSLAANVLLSWSLNFASPPVALEDTPV